MNYEKGLSTSEVEKRIKDGKVNYDTTTPSKSRSIIRKGVDKC